MGHDQLFKQLFQSFFGDLITLLFPRIAARLDLEAADFLPGEHFTDVPDGERREVDLLARVPSVLQAADDDPENADESEIVLVHVEVEAQARPGMDRRLRRYSQQIQLRHDLPVIPLVVYLQGGGADVTEEVLEERVLGLELTTFRYFAFGLSASLAPDYLERDQPLAWALAALMRRGELRPAQHKLACLERIARAEVDPARKYLLVNCVETYLDLEDDDREELESMLTEARNQEVREVRLTWGEKKELGALQQALLRLVRQRFGAVSERTREQIEALGTPDEVYPIFDRILAAESVEHMLAPPRNQEVKEVRLTWGDKKKLEGLRQALLRQVWQKFGAVSERTREQIEALATPDEVYPFLDRVLSANSLEEMGLTP